MENAGKTIYLGVTFREFNGSRNDDIQRAFLKSLERQQYNAIKVVVTTFGERHVRRELAGYKLNFVFYEQPEPSGYRFSLSDVLENAVKEAKQDPEGVVAWTTCDVVLDDDFFVTVMQNYSRNFVATCHPHTVRAGLEHDAVNKGEFSASPNSGMDLIVMDGALFDSRENMQIISEYKFRDWGIFEHFLVGLALLNKGKRINVYGMTRIYKIKNDRLPGSETRDWLQMCWERNRIVLNDFMRSFGLQRDLLNLTYLHMQFRPVAGKRAMWRRFYADYLGFFGGRAKRKLLQVPPASLKALIKRIVPSVKRAV